MATLKVKLSLSPLEMQTEMLNKDFYLVCVERDESTLPLKVFIDGIQAFDFARKMHEKEIDLNNEYSVWREKYVCGSSRLIKVKTY